MVDLFVNPKQTRFKKTDIKEGALDCGNNGEQSLPRQQLPTRYNVDEMACMHKKFSSWGCHYIMNDIMNIGH